MRAYSAFLAVVLAGYAFATWRGWEMGAEKRGHIPESVRQAPGGYRSFNYWRGGK
jgi:hypothetical protein